jgi:hypothetical protein
MVHSNKVARFNFSELNLSIFRGESPGALLWQPRLEYWYDINKKQGTLPDNLKEAGLLDVYDYCYASVRYFTKPLDVRYKNVHVTEQWESNTRLRRTWKTPAGTLTDVMHFDKWRVSRHYAEYKLKKLEDFKVLEYIFQDEDWYWDQHVYEQDLTRVGERGSPQFYFRRSPIPGLFIDHMGFEDAIYAMHDHPELIQHYVEFATEADNAIYEILAQAPIPILNLGENIEAAMFSPPIWKEFMVPYYRKRVEQLHAAGKFVHIHMDGTLKPLLPHLRDCPWDAIEAPTPTPQGDVTLEEIKEAMGDLLLIDGIPAILFLPNLYPVDTLIECAKQVVELFYPRLILGVSDELPPDADIERVRLLGKLAQELILSKTL